MASKIISYIKEINHIYNIDKNSEYSIFRFKILYFLKLIPFFILIGLMVWGFVILGKLEYNNCKDLLKKNYKNLYIYYIFTTCLDFVIALIYLVLCLCKKN